MDLDALALGAWADVLPPPAREDWQQDVEAIAVEAESRRVRASYDTGSITVFEAYLLRAVAEHLQARVVVEVGTFIGTSTCALASAPSVERVYTCDASNDCLTSTATIKTFPHVSSHAMLKSLAAKGVSVDLCFFDGVLDEVDMARLALICRPDTVFALHDYNYGPKIRRHGLEIVPRKGIGNGRLLQRRWPTHRVLEPLTDTTLALLIPEAA